MGIRAIDMYDPGKKMKPAIIAGGRKLTDPHSYYKYKIIRILNHELITHGISGRCGIKEAFSIDRLNFSHGGDGIGERACYTTRIPIISFPANWGNHGKCAGFIRNAEMINFIASHHGIVIILPWGKGTDNTRKLAEKNNLKVFKIDER